MSNQQDCKCSDAGEIAHSQRPLTVAALRVDFISSPYVASFSYQTNTHLRFINNEFVKGVDGKTFETINPSNEKPICSVHEATEKDVDIAVSAARKAFEGSWRTTTPEQRGKYLTKLADLIERDAGTLAAIEALDNGKAVSMANVDVSMVAGCLRYYGGWADKIEGKTLDTNSETFAYTRQEPVSSGLQKIIIGAFADLFLGWCLRSNYSMELPSPHVSAKKSTKAFEHPNTPIKGGHGRSALPLLAETLSSSRLPNKHHYPVSTLPNSSRKPASHQESSTFFPASAKSLVQPSPLTWMSTRWPSLAAPLSVARS